VNKLAIVALALTLASSLSVVGSDREEQTVELKDGGKIVVQKDGKMVHTNAAGKRIRMKDGIVMEGKDGHKYLMKNNAIWKQLAEKGTLAPNR